jgi:hypothetical protein
VLAFAGTAAFFSLTALLWFSRPTAGLWLLGSVVLGTLYIAGFFWYVVRR